ncbi:hypothetical protein [Streptosporangium sp. NPDC001681]|uniref:hypothetical protein n=1 Tax=Streptosporangium sp. NPDC001681 TaxID=3154395 RepID=UPI003325C216
MVFHSAPAPEDEGRRETIAAIVRALRRGMDEGAFRQVDPHAAATILFTVLYGAADAIAAGEQPQRWRAAVRDLPRHRLAVTRPR